MKARHQFSWIVAMLAVSLAGCGPGTIRPQTPTATPTLAVVQTATSTPAGPSEPAPPYAPTSDRTVGRIRGHLFYPSEQIPMLAVYAVATDGSRFYRVDTQSVPPGEPSYEIPAVEPGVYHVYAYRAWDGGGLGGSYSYLTASEAGHIAQATQAGWEDRKHDLAPVRVEAAHAVQEIDLSDWYGPSLPPPPKAAANWQTYTNEQLDYHLRYPPHWKVLDEVRGETTFGLRRLAGEGPPEAVLASVRVTNGDPEELAEELIDSLAPARVVSKEWLPFSGHNSLYLALDLPEGRFAWWFVPRYELVYIVHAVTDSGLGSFDQIVETFAFVEE